MKDKILKGATLLFAGTLMVAAMLKAQGCDSKSQVPDEPAAVEVEPEGNTNGGTEEPEPKSAPVTAPAADAGTDAGGDDMGKSGANVLEKEPVLMPATKSGPVFREKPNPAPVQQQQAPK